MLLFFFLGEKMMLEKLVVVLPSYRDATIYFGRKLFTIFGFMFFCWQDYGAWKCSKNSEKDLLMVRGVFLL